MSDTQEFRVVQASDYQRKRLRLIAERSYEKGLMDKLVLFMTVEQLREAHEDRVLAESEHFADDAAIIKPA